MEKLFNVAKVLHQRAQATTDIAIPGYTHTQKAMPTTAATLLLSYCQYVISLLQDGMALYRVINWNPLGVGSGFGVPLHLDRHHTSTLLGFEREQPNPIFVQSTRGREELKFLTWICDISLLLERASSDLILFSTEEFGFVRLPDKFTTGSSIMPQKRNPDVLELLRAQGSLNRAYRSELDNILSKLPSSYHRDYQYTKDSVFKASKRISSALHVFAAVMKDTDFDQERAKQMLTPELFSTHYAYELVSKEHQPFRVAYLRAAEALKEGKINPLVFIDSFLKEEQQRTTIELDETHRKIVAGEELHQRTLKTHYDACENVFTKLEV
jgi:argininosuccinate lyase